uniref:Uncharacterized protein n=2 Tax=Oncorhynchus tshawytscha TaxID=74940 RepID=A0AAZ3Q667_ONCTS
MDRGVLETFFRNSKINWRRQPRPAGPGGQMSNKTMTQHTSRLCKGYLSKKETDGVLHQMTWPPQSPNLTPIELDHRVKEKQPTRAQHIRELLQDRWKIIPGEAG